MSGKKRLLPYINKSGEEHHSWKGADVGYNQLHAWVRKNKLIPDRCEDCHQVKPLDLANISQEYKRDLSDWEWLCRLCHMKKDGRLEKLRNLHK